MLYFEDCNYEIAQLRAAIQKCYAVSAQHENEGETDLSNVYLEQASSLQQELSEAIKYRDQCQNNCDCLDDDYVSCEDCDNVACDECDWDEDYTDCYYNGCGVVDAISQDLDQSYQLDVLLNELNTLGAQIEYMQNEIDNLNNELSDALNALDYWSSEAIRHEQSANNGNLILKEIYDMASCRVSNICSVESRLNNIFRISKRGL